MAVLALAVTGPRSYSLDAVLGINLPKPQTCVLFGLLALLVVIAGFATRRAIEPAAETKRELA